MDGPGVPSISVVARMQLRWWCTTLGLETLADCHAIRSAVEQALQELGQAGRSGKTLVIIANRSAAFVGGVWNVTISRRILWRG